MPMFRFDVLLSLLGFGPLLLAVGTILVLGWRGRPAWAAPRCRKCRYDLRGQNPEELRHCPECGADLSTRRAVIFSRETGRRWGLIAWGITILLLPFVMVGSLVLYQRVSTRLNPQMPLPPHQLADVSTADLIRYQLPGRVDQPWVWRELGSRLQARTLSRAEAEQAIATLVTHLEQKREAGEPVSLTWTHEFLEPALASNVLSQEALLEFYDAYFGSPAFEPLPRLREGHQRLSLRITGGNPWHHSDRLPHAMVWRVTRTTLDGQPVDSPFNALGRDSAQASLTVDLLPGEHELAATVECLIYDPAAVKGADLQSVPPENWPEGLRRWTVEVPATIRVYGQDEPMIRLVTDPNRQIAAPAISIDALIFKTTEDGPRSEMRYTIDRSLPISISFDAAIRVGEELVPIGSVVYIHDRSNASGQTTRGTQQPLPRSLPPQVRSADVVLTPNPEHVERDARVTEIWGKPVTLTNVELVRLDVPGDDAVESAP